MKHLLNDLSDEEKGSERRGGWGGTGGAAGVGGCHLEGVGRGVRQPHQVGRQRRRGHRRARWRARHGVGGHSPPAVVGRRYPRHAHRPGRDARGRRRGGRSRHRERNDGSRWVACGTP